MGNHSLIIKIERVWRIDLSNRSACFQILYLRKHENLIDRYSFISKTVFDCCDAVQITSKNKIHKYKCECAAYLINNFKRRDFFNTLKKEIYSCLEFLPELILFYKY